MTYRLPVSVPKIIEEKIKEESKRTGKGLAEIIRDMLRNRYKIK